MAAIISTPSSRPWVANAGLAGRNAPRSVLSDRGVGPSVRGEAPRVRKRSFRRGRDIGLRRVQDDALERIARVVPRRPPQRTPRVGIARLPAQANPRRAEIDVLGVVFVVQSGPEELHDVHARQAAILGQVLDDRTIAGVIWHQSDQLRDHVAQLVDLTLSRNMTRDAARILNVLVAVE